VVPSCGTFVHWKLDRVSELIFGNERRYTELYYNIIRECVDYPAELWACVDYYTEFGECVDYPTEL
jgi:hypothetical protein